MERTGNPAILRAVFECYNIVLGRDLRDAAGKLETYLANQNGTNSGRIDDFENGKGKCKSALTNYKIRGKDGAEGRD